MPESGTPEMRQLERTRHLPRCEEHAQRPTSRARQVHYRRWRSVSRAGGTVPEDAPQRLLGPRSP
eukprot:6179958-Pleurochrysis_carterae.AAC.1